MPTPNDMPRRKIGGNVKATPLDTPTYWPPRTDEGRPKHRRRDVKREPSLVLLAVLAEANPN